jgi:hypothetical protein
MAALSRAVALAFLISHVPSVTSGDVPKSARTILISTDDISVGIVKRMSYSLLLPVASSDEAIKSAMSDLIQQKSTANPEVDAIVVFVYFDRKKVSSEGALAKAEWVPNGKWDSVTPEIARTNDRRLYRTKYTFYSDLQYQRDVTVVPTAAERRLHDALKPLLKSRYVTKVDMEAAATKVASQLGVSVDTLIRAYTHVGIYDDERRARKVR